MSRYFDGLSGGKCEWSVRRMRNRSRGDGASKGEGFGGERDVMVAFGDVGYIWCARCVFDGFL
jgi:hypothetical protein